MEKKSLALREFKFAAPDADAPAMAFAGYGAVFGNLDSYDDVIAPGAFAATLAEHKAAGTLPVMLWNHDCHAMPIGVWTDMVEDEFGLKIEGRFLDTSAGRDAYVAAKEGAVTGLSIGYIVTAFEVEKRDGKTVRVITEVRLLEVSVVTFPANDQAQIADIKSKTENQMNLTMQRKSLSRLSQLFAEAEELVAKLAADGSEDETDTVEETDEEVIEDEAKADAEDADDASDDEAKYFKYFKSAITAVRNF